MQSRVAPEETRQASPVPESQLSLAPLGPATTERFRSKYRVAESGCWLWQAGKTWGGYGRFRLNGADRYAHRVSYETFVGQIPDALEIDHLCRVRACVNPAHLETVTRSVNQQRGIGFAGINFRREVCVRGHEFTGRKKSNGTRFCQPCNTLSHRRRYWAKKAGAME